MDLNSLNRDAPISAATIAFLVLAVIGLFGMIFGRTFVLKKFKKWTPPGYIFITSFGLFAIMVVSGFVSVINSQYEVLNNSFHEKLYTDYGLETEATEYTVERAAADHRSLLMIKNGKPILVQTYRDGDTLTFYKVDRGEPITPRK